MRFEEKKMVVDIWKDTDQYRGGSADRAEISASNPASTSCLAAIISAATASFLMCEAVSAAESRRTSSPRSGGWWLTVWWKSCCLGQNVNSYGKNLEQPVTFAELLRQVNADSTALERIRFMTSHPKDLSDDLIEVMRDS